MSEKYIESEVCQHARMRGCLAYKFTSPARAAVPDRLFITPTGTVFFIEFKATGKKATPAQVREIGRLRKQGVVVLVIDNVEDGKATVDMMVGDL